MQTTGTWIKKYDHSIPQEALGLGQDTNSDLTLLVRIPALFIRSSKLSQKLLNGGLKRMTANHTILFQNTKYTITYNGLKSSIGQPEMSLLYLIGKRIKASDGGYASGLVQAAFPGQKSRLAITEWAAKNYVSVAYAFGLVTINYGHSKGKDVYIHVTSLGKQTVAMFETKGKNALKTFILKKCLFRYPYAAWVMRFAADWDRGYRGKDGRLHKHTKGFSKFDLGQAFGFYDGAGFLSYPYNEYISHYVRALNGNDYVQKTQGKKKGKWVYRPAKDVKSDVESTGDKYMRNIAKTLEQYKFLKLYVPDGNKRHSGYRRYRASDGKVYTINVGPTYLLGDNGKQGLFYANNTPKSVKLEFLGTKVNKIDKIRRALIIELLYNGNHLSANQITKNVNNLFPEAKAISSEITDDLDGLNNIGVGTKYDKYTNKWSLTDKIIPFEIPIKENDKYLPTKAQKEKKFLRPRLHILSHTFLQGVDIAYKKSTSNPEDSTLEIDSTELFNRYGLGYHGKHLGKPGIHEPDGYATDDHFAWVIDSKAYSGGFYLNVNSSNEMNDYMHDLDTRNTKNTENWWKPIINVNRSNQYFVYVSSFFHRGSIKGKEDLEARTAHHGALTSYGKLLLLAELHLEHKLTRAQAKHYLCDSNINFDQYSKQL